jgi:uncharacterized protein (DUF1330 family)
MVFERCMGLMVRDEEGYQRYRDAMTPLLQKAGGRFRYDFRVSEALITESSDPINRVFIISFANKDSHDAFFSDPAYQKIRKEHLNDSVSHAARLAAWGE